MTAALRTLALAALLAGPAVLAFFSGGYFDEPRLVAAIAACALLAATALLAPAVVPRRTPGRLALGGLAALTLLVGLSITWAPLASAAQADLQRLLLYLAAFAAGAALLRGPGGLRLVEPAVFAGAFAVIAVALAGRLLPGLVEQEQSVSALGRLEQPLTYWNATGMLAALGALLAVRLAADERRRPGLRLAAAATTPAFGLAVYLSFSRGALLALALGLVLLVGFSRERRQALVAGAAILAALPVCVLAGQLDGVRALEGPSREAQGLAVLLALLVAGALVALAARAIAARPPGPSPAPSRVVGGGLAIIVAAGFLLVAAGGGGEGGTPRSGAETRRLASLQSNRYDYWEVAAGMWSDAPLRGGGSGAFRVEWRRERTIDDPALDAHSLYVETAAELGLLGLLALAAFLAGCGWAAAVALRTDRAAASGAAAALAALAVHAGLDWDWEMPALALYGLLLAAALVGAADEPAAA